MTQLQIVGTLAEARYPKGGDAVVSGGRQVENRFDVEGVAKGDIATSVVVVAAPDGAACGIEVAVGQRAGLLLTRQADRWRSCLCSKVDSDAMLALSELPRTGGSELLRNVGVEFVIGAITVTALSAIEGRARHEPTSPGCELEWLTKRLSDSPAVPSQVDQQRARSPPEVHQVRARRGSVTPHADVDDQNKGRKRTSCVVNRRWSSRPTGRAAADRPSCRRPRDR